MAIAAFDKRLAFRKEWIFDPPPELFSKFEFKNLARLAVIQMRAEHAALKAQEEALEEAMEIYSQFIK